MKTKYNLPFYVIMITGFVSTIGLAVWEMMVHHPQTAGVNLIAALMFGMLTIRKYTADRQMGKVISILNWIILIGIFIAIAAESGLIYK
ncbi:hypothetical protein [uncultured Limosilactobacillus sp.]|uniref:hypothetical protein n=1 Tax=uncultured Limosilactobacillus sp. TaxID=2837629 RepID=UPI0025D06F9D|nr:hypothetical protein [uncultured Limosilactobacillus sp.]